MASGHSRENQFTPSELDDLLGEVLDNPRVKRRLARPYKVDNTYDIALLGSSSIGGHTVYFDRHLKIPGKPYGVIQVSGQWLNVIPCLIRHERLEQAIEDVYGWKYEIAHEIAEHWEEQLVQKMGFKPDAYEKALDPFIRIDEKEPLKKVPTDVDLRPLMANAEPEDKIILAQKKKRQNDEKLSHEKVGYVNKSKVPSQSCGKCMMFVANKYGGPACTLVRDPINAAGYCRRFRKGRLDDV